jgi:putative glutamine amidotransferase
MTQRIVGIAVWKRGLRTPLGDPEILHAVADAYVSAVADTGLVPVLIPNALSAEYAGPVLDRVDGLVLSGGGDVHPHTYGAGSQRSHDLDPRADSWEMALLESARRRKMPALCICRGMQVLNVWAGGSLHQDMLVPGTVHEPLSGKSAEEILAARHDVELRPDGLLARIYGRTVVRVNTIHHQAIDRLGSGMSVEARSEDGFVEALSVDDPGWWCVGVQWHPERNGALDVPLFDAFAREVTGGAV